MAKITAAQYEPAFELGQRVANEQLMLSDAVKFLAQSNSMKEGSAKFYLDALLAMYRGDTYKHTINIPATKYYLQRFYETSTPTEFILVLQSVENNLDFYADQGKGEQVSIRVLVDSYKTKIALHIAKPVYPDEVDLKSLEYTEGSVKQVTINAYERNPKARATCIAEFGAVCQVCDFNFEAVYGEIGKGFIHVHHKIDIATIGKTYKVNPTEDLVPVCPNCHAMLHTETPAMKIEKLRELVKSKS